MQEDVLNLLAARKGHFLLESGHHGDLWLDLELLCQRPQLLKPLVAELVKRLSRFDVDAVCGPLVEGAFVGLMVASELEINFSYSEQFVRPPKEELFPIGYRIPVVFQSSLRRKRVAIVNDVINAGSAVRGTFAALEDCEATVVVIGSLLVLGTAALQFALAKNVALDSIATIPNEVWTPSACPLCSSGAPLEDVAGFRAALQKENKTIDSAD